MSDVLWALAVLGAGLLVTLSGGALAARLHNRGVKVDLDNLTSAQRLSGQLMLGGWLVVAVGVVWLLVLAIVWLVT
jgi:hypothetical protein